MGGRGSLLKSLEQIPFFFLFCFFFGIIDQFFSRIVENCNAAVRAHRG